jgi:O-antigen/teichoic acid export membrane protein
MFYGPEYAKYSDVLRLQMTASALIFTAASMMAGLTAARRFAIQLPLWGSAASITALCCALLIPGGGLRGAGTATVTSAAIQATVTAITVIAVLKRATPREYGLKQ